MRTINGLVVVGLLAWSGTPTYAGPILDSARARAALMVTQPTGRVEVARRDPRWKVLGVGLIAAGVVLALTGEPGCEYAPQQGGACYKYNVQEFVEGALIYPFRVPGESRERQVYVKNGDRYWLKENFRTELYAPGPTSRSKQRLAIGGGMIAVGAVLATWWPPAGDPDRLSFSLLPDGVGVERRFGF